MKKKRSIILISILIIVSAVIYFYKPEQNNSYQLGVIISIGNKDKSNILYYNDFDFNGNTYENRFCGRISDDG